jgi:hypothetical protein
MLKKRFPIAASTREEYALADVPPEFLQIIEAKTEPESWFENEFSVLQTRGLPDSETLPLLSKIRSADNAGESAYRKRLGLQRILRKGSLTTDAAVIQAAAILAEVDGSNIPRTSYELVLAAVRRNILSDDPKLAEDCRTIAAKWFPKRSMTPTATRSKIPGWAVRCELTGIRENLNRVQAPEPQR